MKTKQVAIKTDARTKYYDFVAGEMFTILNEFKDFYGKTFYSLENSNGEKIVINAENIEIIKS
ncbi:MAG: hypothetical protein DRI95_00680 [Bacteroidetes bacterium]|nr:MAG: hypothetical protein DRI95_00680 [Bacteroidota bacterium]